MKCPIENPENAGLLLAYWARKLDPETAGVLERHMETCPACQALHDDQKAVWEALDAWEAPPVSEDFDRRLYGRIEAAAQSSWWERVARWFRPVRIGPGLPLAAAVCL